WLPWPLPVGWLVTGFAGAGDDRTGTRACVVALSGPNPVGGLGEMLLISEEPGVGLGAHFAGLPGPDPGEGFAAGPPHAAVRVRPSWCPGWGGDAAGPARVRGGGGGQRAGGVPLPGPRGAAASGAAPPACPACPRQGPGPAVRRRLAPPAWVAGAGAIKMSWP